MSTDVQLILVKLSTMIGYWARLKPEMEKAGLEIQGLADALGISFQAVVKIRDGGSFGSANNFKAAKLFSLNPEWLASGKGVKNSAPDAVGTLEISTQTSPITHLATALRTLDPAARESAAVLLQGLARDPDGPWATWLGELLANPPPAQREAVPAAVPFRYVKVNQPTAPARRKQS